MLCFNDSKDTTLGCPNSTILFTVFWLVDVFGFFQFSENIIETVGICLGSASRASGGASWLGVGGTCFGGGTFNHHDGEVDVSTSRVLVTTFSGVEATGIGRVTIPSLIGVEVKRRAGSTGVPHGVDLILGSGVPHLSVVLSVHTGREKLGLRADTEGGRGKGRSRSDQCE
jgi:hypothetical protein